MGITRKIPSNDYAMKSYSVSNESHSSSAHNLTPHLSHFSTNHRYTISAAPCSISRPCPCFPPLFRAGSSARPGHVSAVVYVGNGDEMRRVSGDVGVQNGSKVGKAVFEELQKVQSIVRPTRPCELVPLREMNGRMAHSLILGKRFLNLAAVDRIANDVSLDVLAACNAGSFFRNGVVSWRE